MDEEDEIESHPSPSSPTTDNHQNIHQQPPPSSSSSPPPPQQQPVTIAAPPPHSTPPPSHHQTLTLALPIQNPRNHSSTTTTTGIHSIHTVPTTTGGGREDCWSEGATSTLIDAWGERYLELSRGNLKQKHWKDVADIVSSREDYTKPSKTDVQCKNRIDTLKKKYKIEKTKIASGSGPSKWNFFNRLDHLIGPNSKIPTMPTTPTQGGKGIPLPIPVGGSGSISGGGSGGVRSNFYQEQIISNHHHHQQPRRPQRAATSNKARYKVDDTDSSKSEPERDDSPDSTDSFPPETNFTRKRPRFEPKSEPISRPTPRSRATPPGSFRQNLNNSSNKYSGGSSGRKGMNSNSNWGNSMMELTRAILKFGEAYEQIETSKLQQVVEMEQQRMEFTKELELKRMQFFMKTQLEFAKMKNGGSRRGGGGGGGGGNSRRHNSSINHINNNDSDNSG